MRDFLLIAVRKFLESRVVPGKPILLGYSGGPDSKALLYLLIQCRRFFSFELHLAHVDHGWREESKGEAEAIQREADLLHLPLYVQILKPEDFSAGNLEEQGRNYRVQFFSHLYRQHNCQALILGHHADDQAEVVLKRVFEGASLFNLRGLSLESFLEGMKVWRPLLPFKKKEIAAWLSHKKMQYFEDPTNTCKNFLRGRMREEMLPLLKTSFGKEVSSNLCRLGEESGEMSDFFSQLNQPMIASIKKENGGQFLDLNPFLPLAKLQLRYLITEWMRNEGVTFSRQILDDVSRALCQPASRKRFQSNAGHLNIANGTIFFLKD